jgi:hypothetical protein
MALGLLGALALTENASSFDGYSENDDHSLCVSRRRIEEMSRNVGVSVALPGDAIGVCFRFVSIESSTRHHVAAPDISDGGISDPHVEHGNVPPDDHVRESLDGSPVSDASLIPGEVVNAGGTQEEADRQTRGTGSEAGRRCDREEEITFCALHWLLRGVVVVFAIRYIIARATIDFCHGGAARPQLSIGDVAWRIGGVHAFLRAGVEDLQRRGECEVATVNGVRVLHATQVQVHARLPIRLDARTAWLLWDRCSDWQDAAFYGAFWFLLTLGSALDVCGPSRIWWGSFLIRLFVPLAATVVPWVRDAIFGQSLLVAIGLAAGSWVVTTLIGGTAELAWTNVFSACWVVLWQCLLQGLVAHPCGDVFSPVGQTRR